MFDPPIDDRPSYEALEAELSHQKKLQAEAMEIARLKATIAAYEDALRMAFVRRKKHNNSLTQSLQLKIETSRKALNEQEALFLPTPTQGQRTS